MKQTLPTLVKLILAKAESSGAAINRRDFILRTVGLSALYPFAGDILALDAPPNLRFGTGVTPRHCPDPFRSRSFPPIVAPFVRYVEIARVARLDEAAKPP